MGVIITSYRTIIFSLICATLVSMLFFVAGYMLGKGSAVDTDARIAMIFPAQDIEPIEEENVEQVAANETQSDETVEQSAKTESEDKQIREKEENGKKAISKTQPSQPAAKKEEIAKPQSKTQQPDNKKIEEHKKTGNTAQTVKTNSDAQEKPQTIEAQDTNLEKQTEKPAGARYSIQIEAFGVQRNAERYLDKIKEKYPSAYIFENKQKKRLPLAVRVGYFVSYRKALEAAKVFQAREKRAAMVVKINQ